MNDKKSEFWMEENQKEKMCVKRAISVFMIFMLIMMAVGCGGIDETKAREYVQANLDLTFQGETQGAKKILGASNSDLKKVYESGIQAFVQNYLLDGVETENDFSETYGALIKEIFLSVKYKITDVKKEDGKTCKVTVQYEPIDVFPQFMPELKKESEKIQADKDAGKYSGTEEEIKKAMTLDYMTGAYDLLRSAYLDMQYDEKQEFTFQVTCKSGNTYSMEEDEINSFMERILELDKL